MKTIPELSLHWKVRAGFPNFRKDSLPPGLFFLKQAYKPGNEKYTVQLSKWTSREISVLYSLHYLLQTEAVNISSAFCEPVPQVAHPLLTIQRETLLGSFCELHIKVFVVIFVSLPLYLSLIQYKKGVNRTCSCS
jgi:hypothetical protein